MNRWWVTQRGREPVGPVETELVVRGIAAEKVPGDALVCPVGGKSWQPLDAVPRFAQALAQHRRGAGAMDAESTIIDLPPIPSESAIRDTTRPEPALTIFDDATEKTIVDIAPLPPSEPPPARPHTQPESLSHFEEFEERTIVEKPRR
jgi:hypothetical protein